LIFFDSADRGIQIIPTRATPLVAGKNYWVELNRLTGQFSAIIDVPAGVGGIWLENSSGSTSEAHLYFVDAEYGTFLENVDYSYLVGKPGSTTNAITVGSYDWNDNFHEGGRAVSLTAVCRGQDGRPMPFEIGWLSCYSSPGPNRNGVIKPEIAAPGEWFAASNAKVDGENAGEWAREDSTGNYRRMNGTSAATPYTAGIVALMFQKKPTLTLGAIRDLLKGKASKSGLNPFRQAVPNNNWGYGKLDMAAVDRIFAAIL
jgi:subtilisin family serine protease